MGFTDLLSRLPSSKALSNSHYDDEFVIASIDKIQKILTNRPHSNFVAVNTVDRPAIVVKTYSLFNIIIPSGIQNSSEVIGRNLLNSSLAYFDLEIIVGIISCIARSMKICHNYHARTENCTSNCLSIDNSKLNFKSITFTDKVLLHFILENRQFLRSSKKRLDFPMDKFTEPLSIIPEEHNIALKFRDDRLSTDHANLVKRYKSDLNLPHSLIRPENHCSKKFYKSWPGKTKCCGTWSIR